MSRASDALLRGSVPRRGLDLGLAVLGALLLLLLPLSAAAESEREELEALRAEIRAERAAMAKEREALADQRRRLDDTLAELDQREGAIQGQPVESDAPKIRLDVYGFIHTDAIYDFDRMDPKWKSALRPSRIPVDCPGDSGCGNDGETVLSVKQSRLGFRGFVPTPVGEIKTKFEFELFGVGDDAGETTFRLRHAYAELGQFGAGQTWSLFMDPDVFPNTIEYWGPVGMAFFRNPQIRWTPIDHEGISFAVAVENPGSALDQGKVDTDDLSAFGDDFSDWNQYPDFTTHVRGDFDWGHIQLAALVRVLGFEIRSNNGDDPDGQEIGAAGNLSGTINLFEGDKILWQVVGGQGFANYMNDGGTDLAPNDDLDGAEAVKGIGWLLYYNRQWSERWTSSIGFSEHRQFTTQGQSDDAFELGQYGNVNLLFHPTPGMYVGPEFIWGRLENRDGADGTDSRVQLSFHFDFGATIIGRSD